MPAPTLQNKRERIIAEIVRRLKEITPASAPIGSATNYETEAGRNVFEWRTRPLQDDELPALAVYDTESIDEAQTSGIDDHTLSIKIVAIARASDNTAREVRKMIADVTRCIGADRYIHEGGDTGNPAARLAFDVLPDSSVIDQDGETAKVTGGGVIGFKIRFRTKKFNPYE